MRVWVSQTEGVLPLAWATELGQPLRRSNRSLGRSRHGKSAAGSSRPDRPDVGVRCQQVGLADNLVEQLDAMPITSDHLACAVDAVINYYRVFALATTQSTSKDCNTMGNLAKSIHRLFKSFPGSWPQG